MDPLLQDEYGSEDLWPRMFSGAFKKEFILCFQVFKDKFHLTDAMVLRE